MPAPIALFAFNRPDHLRRTLEALAANELAAGSELTIFCDGPRNAQEASQTGAVREVAHAASGFKSLAVLAGSENRGLAPSIISGVTRMVEQYGEVIVLEDDLITSPWFLRYMNDGLTLYAHHPKVASIHGYMFPHKTPPADDTFFLRGADCWGWGTWKRAWSIFDPDAAALLRRLRRRGQTFAFNRFWSYNYTGMLRDVTSGRTSSWAVRWLASAWLNDMYTLYPSQSLIFHAGSDGSGTNCGTDSFNDVPLATRPMRVEPAAVREDAAMAGEFRRYLRKSSGGVWIGRNAFLRDHPMLYAALRRLKQCLRLILMC